MATATSDWLDERAADAQAAPQTPFDMPSYVLDNAVRAEEKQAQAEQLSAQALTSNINSDSDSDTYSYTVLTILFATVLFFAAVSNRVRKSMNSWTLIGVALVVFVGSATVLA